MRIALDYDGTYTADPAYWDNFIRSARQAGHQVLIVTFRPACCPVTFETLPEEEVGVIYTSGAKKRAYCQATMAIQPDIWIDDMPELI